MSDSCIMSGAEADVSSSDADSSFEQADDVPLPPSPLKQGTATPFEVRLKGGGPWGFNLNEIQGTRTPVQVSEIVPDGHADKHGGLKVGDYILMVNDVKCTSVTEAVQLIESAFRTLTLQVWRGTTEPLTSPVRSASILQKVRESARQQASTQDDSALLSESKNRMKPRQRRIESFHGRRGSAHSSSSSASPSKLTSGKADSNYQTSSQAPTAAQSESTAAKEPLKGWATEHDLSGSRQPVIMSGSQTSRVPSSRHMPLSAAKSSPSLNNEELINAVTTPRGYSPKPTSLLNITKSTPDIPDQLNYENVTSPTSPKSPSWYQQKFPGRSMFEFPSSGMRRSSPRNSYSGGSPRNSYAGYSSSYSSQSGYPQSSHSTGFSPTSVPSSVTYPPHQTNVEMRPRTSSSTYTQSPRLIGANANSYDDSAGHTPTATKNYDRRSLPPQMLYQMRQEFLKESSANKPEPQKQLTSMPVTREEEEAERKQFHQNGVESSVSYTPPAPPVRDISSLKYVGMSRNHEKYPSWPVTTANPPQNLGPPVEAHPVEGQTAEKSVERDSDKEKSDRSSSSGSKSSDKNSSVTLERKGSDDGKQPRNQSDPGFKKTKNTFYTSRKPKTDRERNYENLKSEDDRFEDFYKQSKPGYPPPKFDPDGHNYGDEKYNIPSPPERDTPHLDEKSLVKKIAAVISPNSHHSYQQYTVSPESSGSKSNKVDSGTSPPKVPGFYFQKALNQSQTTSTKGMMVDSATSPLTSPKSETNLKTISANPTSDNYLSPTDKSRGLIIRQKPYYNTSTQTDSVFIPDSQSNKNTENGEQSSQNKLSSHSSVATDNESHDASTGSSGIGSMTISDHASAPMLRKLSEEFFGGKLSGGLLNDKRQSSASGYDESLYSNLREAESYSSVVIHPHETSAPFGHDDFGLGSTPRDAEMEADPHYKYKPRYSMDSSTLLHKSSGSFSMPPRSLQESRFTSESNLSANPTPRTHSQSLYQLNRPSSSSSSSHADLRKTTMSDSSSSSRPHGSMEARSSSGSRLSSDSSTSGRAMSRRESDSVFYERSSPVTKESSETAASSSASTVGRKESMKMAYGTYDEQERHYATPYGHQRNSSEVLSTSSLSPDQSTAHARSQSHADYMQMSYNQSESNRLGQIKEEGSEIRWQEAVLKSRSLSKDAKLTNYANFSFHSMETRTPSKESDSEGSSSDKKKDKHIKRTVSEQIRPAKADKTVSEQIRPAKADKTFSRNSETKDYSSSGESSKGNKSDGESAPRSGLSDSELKRQQQRAVLDFFERKIKTPDGSEPLSPRSETAPSEFPPPPPENKPPMSPQSQPPQSPLSDITKRYNYTKAQRTESLRRNRSSISSTSSRDSDYMEMNRLQRASHYQTEWSRLRSQESGASKRPLSIGSDISMSEQFHVGSSSPQTSDGESLHQRSESETIPKQLEAEMDKVVEAPIPADGPHPNSNETMVTTPIYHNFQGGDFPRRPPPPVPGSGSDEKPPALPPRAYQRPFTHSKSESMLRIGSNSRVDSTSLQEEDSASVQKWEHSTNGTLREDAYAAQLRQQARRFSEQHHKPTSMQVVSTKTPMHVSVTQSFKQEPNQAMEAVPPQNLASSVSAPNLEKISGIHHSPPMPGDAMSPGPSALPPLPTPLKNGETEIVLDGNTSMEFPPPPPEFMEGADQDTGKRYADDSYASYKSKAAPREVGKYNRTVSDSSVLRAQQDNKLRQSDLSNITETPNKPPRKKLELGPDLGLRAQSPSMTGGDSQKPSPHVPSFKAAETSPVPHAQKSVAKPLQSVQKLSSPVTSSGSSGSFISTVVQRPSNQSGSSVPEDARPSVKDFVKNIEVYTHSPVLNKAGSLNRDSPVTDRKSVFPGDSSTPTDKGTSQSTMDSLEKLESSVKSSDSFRDRLRPVVRKIESEGNEDPSMTSSRRPERGEEPPYSSSRRSRERRSNDRVDHVVGLPPEVPSRTYKEINYTGDQRTSREAPYRSNSFQGHNPAVHHPRPYDRSKNTGSGYSPVEMNNYKNRKEPQRSPSQSVPEPQVPVRGHNQSYPQRQSHDIPDKYSDKLNSDQNAKNPSPEHRVSRSSPDHRVRHSSPNHRVRHPSDKNENNNRVQNQTSVPNGQKRRNDNSFVNQGKSQIILPDSQVKDIQTAEKNIHNAYTPLSCSYPNTQTDNVNKGENSLTADKSRDTNRTRVQQSNKSTAAITSYRSGDFRNWRNDKTTHDNSNKNGIQDLSRSAVVQSNRSNSQSDINKMADRAENRDTHTVEIAHIRQASAEELECDKKAQELAQVLKESDKELSSVLTTDTRKVRMRFMEGILSTESDGDDLKRRPRSQSEVKEKKKEEKKEEPTSPMPSEYYVSPPKAMIELEIRKFGDTSQLTQDIGENYTLAEKKEELLQRMIRKVDILKEDRKELTSDIDENESLGKQVLSLVEEKCRSQQEKDKYKSYIEDIDKIIRLLLKLSGLLARAENTIQGQTEGTNEKIRKQTLDKRDRLHKQHEDAKELKIDIDRRREQVEAFLKEALAESEMDDYHYYIKMKSKYIIQMQELEDKITLGNEQIGALQKSMPNKS